VLRKRLANRILIKKGGRFYTDCAKKAHDEMVGVGNFIDFRVKSRFYRGIPDMKTIAFTLLLTAFITITSTGCAEFKSAGKTIGHASRDAAVEIGHGTKRVFNEATADQ
jgi:hypothetical protein